MTSRVVRRPSRFLAAWRSIGAVVALASTTAACGEDASAQAPFTIAGVTAAPGAMASGIVQVAPRGGDSGAEIPFTIIRGRSAGPTLLLVAGTHGAEYVPIVALQRLRSALDPATLTGTVLLVHVANMPSYLGRTVYYSPADGKNLNRVFPGKADGTAALWVDCRLDAERTGMDFRGTYDGHSINAVLLEAYWNRGSPVDQRRWYDDFVVSTRPIGPVCAPAAPTLRLTGTRPCEVELAAQGAEENPVWRSPPASGRVSVSAPLSPGRVYVCRVRAVGGEWSPWHQPFRVLP